MSDVFYIQLDRELIAGIRQLTVAKKTATCRFYRDSLQKVDSICSKTVTRQIF